MIHRLYSALVMLAAFTIPVHADFVHTKWTVENFVGEAWSFDPEEFIGETQSFDRGYSEGVFFTCRFEGQSLTYNRYQPEVFFQNPEFESFGVFRDEMSDGATTFYVHRITCANPEGGAAPKVLYPFVTNDVRQQAWYLLGGGVFSLRH